VSPVAATMPGMPARDVNTNSPVSGCRVQESAILQQGIEVNIGDYKKHRGVIRDARPAATKLLWKLLGSSWWIQVEGLLFNRCSDNRPPTSTIEISSTTPTRRKWLKLVKSMSGADKVVIVSPPVLSPETRRSQGPSTSLVRWRSIPTTLPAVLSGTAQARCDGESYSQCFS